MIPTYEEIMLPLLKVLSDGRTYTFSEVVTILENYFELTETEKKELLPSGKYPLFRNRVGWSNTYLKKAQLIDSPKRAVLQISERGKEFLKSNPKNLDTETLLNYKEFRSFKLGEKKRENNSTTDIKEAVIKQSSTPEEELEYAFVRLKKELAKELLDVVKSSSPSFFEQLVVDLLVGMGYGGSRKDAGEALGKSGDGGIDGIIKEDRLGLDTIYIQAKRWENNVPVKEIRDFAGALLSKKSKKGIFLTTSAFPKGAYDYVASIEPKIILIDGEKLTDYMIEFNIGVTTVNSFDIKSVDTDYFQ